jgi:hypothetical protein
LHADSVEFSGLSLVPPEGRYEESPNDNGSIAINFHATLKAEETERLRKLLVTRAPDSPYMPVTRNGVSEEARSMRFGRVVWQRLDDGNVGHAITLVDEAFDQNDESPGFQSLRGEPELGNLVGHVSKLLTQFETLLTELEAAGAVTPEAVGRVREVDKKMSDMRRVDFFEVADLSQW